MQDISNYIENLKIKKTFFAGYDREDVFVKMQELVELFQKYVDEEQEHQKEVIKEYETQLQTSQLLINELNKKLSSLSAEQKNFEQEKDRMKGVYKEYCTNILQQYSDSLRSLSTEFTQILDNITSLQQNIIDAELFEGLEDKIQISQKEILEENKESKRNSQKESFEDETE